MKRSFVRGLVGLGASVIVAFSGCATDRGPFAQRSSGGAPPPLPTAPESAVPLPKVSAEAVVSATPTASAAPRSRIEREWSPLTQAIVQSPSEVLVGQLSASGFVDPSTEDFGEKRVGGFPLDKQWGSPKSSDFASKLRAILLDDASYDFDVVTRCAPAKGVVGLVLRHRPQCAPTDSCALDVTHVVINFPCHQVFVTTRVQTDKGWRGQTWAAHFGPAKDRILDLLTEGFPTEASTLKGLR